MGVMKKVVMPNAAFGDDLAGAVTIKLDFDVHFSRQLIILIAGRIQHELEARGADIHALRESIENMAWAKHNSVLESIEDCAYRLGELAVYKGQAVDLHGVVATAINEGFDEFFGEYMRVCECDGSSQMEDDFGLSGRI